MPSQTYSRADFRSALHALLPRGRVWPREEGTAQAKTLDGLSAVYERQTADSAGLLTDAFPATAHQLLPEWESTLGLSELPTVQQRQHAVVGQLIGIGGQSIPFITAYAKAVGHDITITQFAPARAGAARAGTPANGRDWAFAWRVNTTTRAITYARAGRSSAGEPVAAWGSAPLETALRKIAAAHTIMLTAYQVAWDEGGTVWDGGVTSWE